MSAAHSSTDLTAPFVLPMEQSADITFTFNSKTAGDAKPSVVRAHKLILSGNSKVFELMFYGSLPFDAKDDTVAIEDIDRETFEEMLSFIYGNKLQLNQDNVFKLMYASEKYMLGGLKDKCEEFVVKNTDQHNVLSIFERSQLYNSPLINQKCLSLLLDDPIQFFEQTSFLRISGGILKKWIEQDKINCTKEELKKATLRWLDYNYSVMQIPDEHSREFYTAAETVIGVKSSDFENKQFFNAFRNYLPNENYELVYSKLETISINHVYLHGVALYLGLNPTKEDPKKIKINEEYFKEIVTIVIKKVIWEPSSDKKTTTILRECSTQITQTDLITIRKIMFEKLLIKLDKNEELTIEVDFGEMKQRAMFIRRYGRPTEREYKTSVISYLIYSKWSDEDLTRNLAATKTSDDFDGWREASSLNRRETVDWEEEIQNAEHDNNEDWNDWYDHEHDHAYD